MVIAHNPHGEFRIPACGLTATVQWLIVRVLEPPKHHVRAVCVQQTVRMCLSARQSCDVSRSFLRKLKSTGHLGNQGFPVHPA